MRFHRPAQTADESLEINISLFFARRRRGMSGFLAIFFGIGRGTGREGQRAKQKEKKKAGRSNFHAGEVNGLDLTHSTARDKARLMGALRQPAGPEALSQRMLDEDKIENVEQIGPIR